MDASASSRLLPLAKRIVEKPSSPYYAPGVAVVVKRAGQPAERVYLGADAAGQPVSAQSLFPSQFDRLMAELRIIAPAIGRSICLEPVARRGWS